LPIDFASLAPPIVIRGAAPAADVDAEIRRLVPRSRVLVGDRPEVAL
jgi:hypothetical protein